MAASGGVPQLGGYKYKYDLFVILILLVTDTNCNVFLIFLFSLVSGPTVIGLHCCGVPAFS